MGCGASSPAAASPPASAPPRAIATLQEKDGGDQVRHSVDSDSHNRQYAQWVEEKEKEAQMKGEEVQESHDDFMAKYAAKAAAAQAAQAMGHSNHQGSVKSQPARDDKAHEDLMAKYAAKAAAAHAKNSKAQVIKKKLEDIAAPAWVAERAGAGDQQNDTAVVEAATWASRVVYGGAGQASPGSQVPDSDLIALHLIGTVFGEGGVKEKGMGYDKVVWASQTCSQSPLLYVPPGQGTPLMGMLHQDQGTPGHTMDNG